jgi:cytochrome c
MAAIAGAAGVASSPAWADGDTRKAGSADAMTDGTSSQFPDLKRLGPDHRVQSIVYRHDIYRVTTTGGQSTEYLEANLRFRIDSSDTGPLRGKPVILPSGTIGDRALVFFASPDEISAYIKRQG